MSWPEYENRTYSPGDDLVDTQPAIARDMRVPLLASEYPRYAYITGVVVRDEMYFETGIMPTDDEFRILGSFLEEYCQHWYRQSFRDVMARFAPYDIDGGANLAYFIKREDGGWCYRKRTWTTGLHWWPAREHSPLPLVEVLDRLHDHVGGKVSDRWVEWKAAHSDVFAETYEEGSDV